jgi:hypothetical protein
VLCYIAVSVLSIGTKLYIFFYQMYQIQRDLIEHNIFFLVFWKFVYESSRFIITEWHITINLHWFKWPCRLGQFLFDEEWFLQIIFLWLYLLYVSNLYTWSHSAMLCIPLVCVFLYSILLLADSFIFFRFYFYQYMVVFLFNTVIYLFLLLGLCIPIVQLPWLRVFRAFSSLLRRMPGYNSPRRSTARTVPIYFCVVLCMFVCKCVPYYCHRVTTHLHLTNTLH